MKPPPAGLPAGVPAADGHWLDHKVPPPVVDATTALLMWGTARLLPGLQTDCSPAWRWGGLLALCLLGGSMGLAGLWTFARARTTFNPLHPERTTRVVQTGIYRLTRNPMYLGISIMLLGWGLWLAHPLALLWVPLAMAYLQRFQIRPEERILRAHFGEAYEDYCQRVRRWL